MIKAERMSKVTILCPKTYVDKVINKLYDLNVYHLIPHQKTEELDIGSPLDKSEKLAEVLIKLRSLISHLDIEKEKDYELKEMTEKDFYNLGHKSRKLYEDVAKNLDLVKETDEEISKIALKIKLLKILRDLRIDSSYLKESAIMDKYLGYVNNVVQFENKLKEVTNRYELVKTKHDGKDTIALFTEKKSRDEIMPILTEAGYAEIDTSQIEDSSGRLVKSLRDLTNKSIEFNKKKTRIEAELSKLKKENKKFLLMNEQFLAEESKKAEIPLKFASTEKSMLIKGWVPNKKLSRVKQDLMSITENKIYSEEEKPSHEEPVPVKLKHSKWVKPFEFFLQLYELPNYSEIDPTFLLFLTFPIFFGFMLGDVGYGIVTLLLFVILKKTVAKTEGFRALLNIMIFASIVTIVFGFTFGEYFGFEHVSYEGGKALCETTGVCLPLHEIHLGGHEGEAAKVADFPRLMNRAHASMNVFGFDILSVLVIGAIVGFFHLNFALLIGFINIWSEHGIKHAFLEKISWLVMEAGVILIALAYTGLAPVQPWTGFVVLALSIVLIYMGEGVQGMVELPAIFSNMLSYMRLGAVGLASVGLAVVVNENLAMPFIEKGGVFIFVAIIVMIIGHVINIGLGILGPFLHSIRLHYVEFFSKFYKGGGIEYKPFGYSRKA